MKTKKNILIVEDDKFIADIYKRKFNQEGFGVEIAKDGLKALKIIREKKPDLLLLDIILPGFNGWQILRQIKEDQKLKDLKVVILSNLEQRKDIEKGIKLGAQAYLIKAHYTPSEVVKEIKKII
jgi:DNA-binding response OmpR family regulator